MDNLIRLIQRTVHAGEIRPEIDILAVTDTGRRRRWTDAEKVRIVEESFSPRGSVAETARRRDIGRTLLVRWRCPRFRRRTQRQLRVRVT
ncbi:transposase [Sulfitobacter sp. 1A12126]|uniref:transposase n=1 Tax=Sulfitobacter sp. 1A12126 TaxID=3368591 RepID=UPI003745E331